MLVCCFSIVTLQASAAPLEPAAPDAIEDVVLSAMKTRTTVQEAPAIISVLTAEKIEEQGYQRFGDAVGSVPGFLPATYAYGLISTPIARGMLFGTLLLFDGVDMYDPIGFPLMTELLPVQAVQRAEVVSGPGGVLWGANSFVGVVNVVSKTADDMQGIESSVGYGSGVHRRNQLLAHINAGT
jgi:outer membrane receptor for ferrienterochelin and colicin